MQFGTLNAKAPDLRVATWIDGKGDTMAPLKLADLGNQYKVIYCFQHWCPGCHSHGFPTLKSMVDLLSTKGFGFAVVQTVFEGGEMNTFDKLRENQIKYDLRIPFGHDAASSASGTPALMKDYRTGGTPWFTIIDPGNQVVYSDFHLNLDSLLSVHKAPDDQEQLVDAALTSK